MFHQLLLAVLDGAAMRHQTGHSVCGWKFVTSHSSATNAQCQETNRSITDRMFGLRHTWGFSISHTTPGLKQIRLLLGAAAQRTHHGVVDDNLLPFGGEKTCPDEFHIVATAGVYMGRALAQAALELDGTLKHHIERLRNVHSLHNSSRKGEARMKRLRVQGSTTDGIPDMGMKAGAIVAMSLVDPKLLVPEKWPSEVREVLLQWLTVWHELAVKVRETRHKEFAAGVKSFYPLALTYLDLHAHLWGNGEIKPKMLVMARGAHCPAAPSCDFGFQLTPHPEARLLCTPLPTHLPAPLPRALPRPTSCRSSCIRWPRTAERCGKSLVRQSRPITTSGRCTSP